MPVRKHLLVLLCALGVSALAVCGAQAEEAVTAPETTLDCLMGIYAMAGNANARYLAYAKQASLEDYSTVASLFKATAFAEEIHAKRFAELIEKMGGVPNAVIETPVVRSTKENLEAAAATERDEQTMMYEKCLAKAQEANDKDAIDVLKQMQLAEASHVRRYEAGLENFENLQGWQKDFFVCPTCGYVIDVLTLRECPVCGTQRANFKRR